MTKRMMLSAESMAPQIYWTTRHQRFRSRKDVWSIYIATQLCVDSQLCTLIDPAPSNFVANVNQVQDLEAMFTQIVEQKPILVCVNNGSPAMASKLQQGYETLFSSP